MTVHFFTPESSSATPGQSAEMYRGFEIYLSNPRMVCGWMVAGLRRPCRDIAHGREIVDAHLALPPRQPGELRVVAVLPGGSLLSASECRNRSERQTGVWAGRKAGNA